MTAGHAARAPERTGKLSMRPVGGLCIYSPHLHPGSPQTLQPRQPGVVWPKPGWAQLWPQDGPRVEQSRRTHGLGVTCSVTRCILSRL